MRSSSTGDVCLLQHLCVWNFALPADVKEVTETPEMEVVDLPLVPSVRSLCFAATAYCGKDNCSVDFQVGCEADPSPLTDVFPESLEGAACFRDPVVDLSIDGGVCGRGCFPSR